MRSLREIPVLENIPVLVRAALNVPIKDGVVANTYRLERALPTLRYLTERGARVIVISHIGDKGTETLEPVAKELEKRVAGVSFFGESIGVRARAAARATLPGHVLVLENLRRHRGEQNNASPFAHELAALADVFVQDSFDTCHRLHASIVRLPELLPSYAGLLLEEEVAQLSRALAPAHKALAVIGGSKFSTKETVLVTLLEAYDHVVVGGALANDFLKASGYEVGRSLVSHADPSHLKRLLANPRLILPVDVVVVPSHALGPAAREHARIAELTEVRPDETILDLGPRTRVLIDSLVQKAASVLWNGPLGMYEGGFTDATDACAESIATSRAHSMVGGGDTIAAIEQRNLSTRFSFLSTGGGAMLDFLAKGTLPGIEALG